MFKKSMVFILVFVAVTCFGSSRRLEMRGIAARPERMLPPMRGEEILSSQVTAPAAAYFLQGYPVDTIGSTTYDWQYNACALSRLVFDSTNGFIHAVWTWSDVDDPWPDRHVYYNAWDPGTQQWVALEGMDGGYPVQSERGGYPTLDVNSSGCAVVALHRQPDLVTQSRSSVAIDIAPGLGIFEMHDLPNSPVYIIWPRVAVDASDNMVVVSRNAVEGADDAYYSVSNDAGVTWTTPWTFLDSISSVSQNAFASKQSETMVMMWTKELAADGYNDHLLYQVSTDGGQTWGRPRDVTALMEHPAAHSYEWWQMRCTLWGGYGMFDMNDEINMVFEATMAVNQSGYYYPWLTTALWYYRPDFGLYPISLYPQPWIFAFSETFGNCQLADKPSLGQDPATGYLYCVWVEFPYDNHDPVNTDFGVADIYAARSMDGGMTWGPKVNLTLTSDLHEIWPHFAPVVNDSLHIMYQWDLQSGSHVQGNSAQTDNPYHYLKIPVVEGDVEVVSIDDPPHWNMDSTTFADSTYVPKATFRNAGGEPVSFQAKFEITTPGLISLNDDTDTLYAPFSLQYGIVDVADLAAGQTVQVTFPAWTCSTWMSGYWAHYTASACLLGDTDIAHNVLVDSCIVDSVSVGVEEMAPGVPTSALALYQNYPNPMGSGTTIRYQIPEGGMVSLSVYDSNGRLVRNLVSGHHSEGSYETSWDGRNDLGNEVSCGVYFYRLVTPQGNRSQKLALMN